MAVKQILVGKEGSSAKPLTLIKGDSNTQIIEMIVQRYYGGVDLGGLTWDVVFENAEGKSDVHYLTDIKVGNVNIRCNWKPHGLATQAAGMTKFQLEGYAEDNSGATAMVWQSGAYYFNVSDDMNYVPGEGENEALADVHKLIMYVDKELPGVVQAGSDAAAAAAAANAAAQAADAAAGNANAAAGHVDANMDAKLTERLDKTLSVENGIADAKATGDALRSLKGDLTDVYVRPEDYGAEGNEINDDTQALIDAFTSGRNVLLKKGKRYKCIDKILVQNKSNIVIDGNGSEIFLDKEYEQLEGNEGFITFEGCTNVVIKNIKVFTTNAWVIRPKETDEDFETYIDKRNSSYSGIYVKNCNNFEFANLELYNVRNGLFISNTADSIVCGCIIHATFADAILVTGASRRINIENCTSYNIDDDVYSADGFGNGIEENPAYITFCNCNAYNCVGALVCLEGSFHSSASNCKGVNLSIKPFKLGYLTDDGNNAKGDYQTLDNCYIDISSNYYGPERPQVLNEGADVVHAKIVNCTILSRYNPDIEFIFKNGEIVVANNRISNVGMRFIETSANITGNVLNLKGGIVFESGLASSVLNDNIIVFNQTSQSWYGGADIMLGATNLVIIGNNITSYNTKKESIIFSDSAKLKTDFGNFDFSWTNYYKIEYVGVYDLDSNNVKLANFKNGQMVKQNGVVGVIWDGEIIN